MPGKRKLLMISSRTPYPLIGGGRIRVYNLGKLLRQRYEVHLLFINDNGARGHRQGLSGAFDELIEFPYPAQRLILNSIPGILSRKPVQVSGNYFARIQDWVNGHIADYYAVLCSQIRTAEYVRRLPEAKSRNILKILEYCDAISLNYQIARSGARGFWKYFYWLEYPRVRDYEASIIESFDLAFVASPVDRDYLLRNFSSKRPLEVIPMGVDPVGGTGNNGQEDDTIVFMGQMDYFPNEIAAEFFVEQVFPSLLGKHPELKFYIVGAFPTKTVRRLASRRNVVVTGFVDDPLSYVRRAKVFVSPQLIGAGMQTKVLIAMSLGKAVVATSKALASIEGKSWDHFVVADSAEQIAEDILKLLADPALRSGLGERARALVSQRYSWEQVGKKMFQAIDSACGETNEVR
ncbi:MAG: glycosyltransferase [Candidatus Saganbacteria bacterium]|nr:glycosyltransferase [Candidatus Saganbacteria bacterium]